MSTDGANTITGDTITEQLCQAGYVLAELPSDAPDSAKLEALTGAVAVLSVVTGKQAEQIAELHAIVGQLGEAVAGLAPMLDQLAQGGPGAILGMLTGRR